MSVFHDVVYTHTCPRNGLRRVLVIQYNNAEHELANLQTQHEHVCARCRQPMDRLGSAVDLKRSGEGREWLQEAFYDEVDVTTGALA